jgi:hypothetical protein
VELSPLHQKSRHSKQAPSPPQPTPQPQEAPTDVLEQTADLVDLIISSVVPPEQTSTDPLKVKY